MNAIDTITRTVIVVAAIVVGAMYLLGGAHAGVGAAWGGGLSVANWLALRWVMQQVATGSTRKRTILMALLVLKMGLLGAICWVLVVRVQVEPLGFILGLGAMVPSIFLGISLSRGGRPGGDPPSLEDEAPSTMRSSHAPR